MAWELLPATSFNTILTFMSRIEWHPMMWGAISAWPIVRNVLDSHFEPLKLLELCGVL